MKAWAILDEFIMIAMKKYYEVLAMAHPCVEIDDTALPCCDLSRTKIKIYQYGTSSPSTTSKFHANPKQNKLAWDESLQLKFTGQKKLAFQVYCESQGQQNASLDLLFRGVYYVNAESDARKDSCHVYSPQGEKQGLLRWEASRITREEVEAQEEEIKIQKPLFPQNLIGIIRIFQATLEISNPVFNKKKHPNPNLVIAFGPQSWNGDYKNDYTWGFGDIKIQYLPQSSQTIEVQLLQDDLSLLNGSISCDGIRKLKRYLRHSVSVFNRSQIKVGTLSLELRYMDKEELIGFVYSPQNNPNYTKRTNLIKIDPPKVASKSTAAGEAIMKRNQSFQQETRIKQPPNRYAMHNSDVLLPKTARFPPGKPSHPYVSYIDPERSSDFSPKRKRGWDMSLGRKFDFTRQYRGNPGVGSYKLPSIWGEQR